MRFIPTVYSSTGGSLLRTDEHAKADFIRQHVSHGWTESDALMTEFDRYRTFHGLSPMPAPDEQSPAILSVAGDVKRHLTPTAVYLIAKAVFRQAAEILAPTNPAGAATLARASTHWLRHSAASHQADAGTDIRFIQKNLRHASIETTGLYLHAEDDRRHAHTVSAQGD